MALGQGLTGGTNTPSQTTEYLDALLSTSLAAYKKTLVDNIFKENAFLTWLKMSGAWKSQNGGERIACPLMYGKNATAKSYRGYDELDVTPLGNLGASKILFYCWNLLKPFLLTGNNGKDHNGQSATNSNIAGMACRCMGV